MRTGRTINGIQNESAIASLLEYLMVSAVIMVLFIVVMLLVNTNIIQNPADRVVYTDFTDIGNGVSTRMIDVYSIGPSEGTVWTKFDIPDEIVGAEYTVDVGTRENPTSHQYNDQFIRVSRNNIVTDIGLAGIGISRKAGGSTTGRGMNTVCYNSTGVVEGVKC